MDALRRMPHFRARGAWRVYGFASKGERNSVICQLCPQVVVCSDELWHWQRP
jgi:hypothetical protein